jgi:hypothetical protein
MIPVYFGSLPVPVAVLAGGDGRFDVIVQAVDARYHVHATRIPWWD